MTRRMSRWIWPGLKPGWRHSATVLVRPAVYTMLRIWSYKFALAPIAQILVESDSGDSLSPKYAPETTAPAVAANGASIAPATPINATPMVPAEAQDEPVSDMTAVTRNAVTIMNCGLTSLTP